MELNKKTKLSNFEVYDNSIYPNENFIYYNDLTCKEVNDRYTKYYKLKDANDLNVSISLYEKMIHREDGPAIERASGTKEWYLNGERHRTDGPAIDYINGTKHWYLNGKLHRTDGPATEYFNGDKEYYLNGERHRTDGPAIENLNGDKQWYLNGERHREDGPAIEYPNGTKQWYLNGERHREDGPAVELSTGTKKWYLNGKQLTLFQIILIKLNIMFKTMFVTTVSLTQIK